MSRRLVAVALAAAWSLIIVLPSTAHAPSGAIFTTLADGTEVNLNHFDAKEDVYLDGGPGPGAPQTAAGLDDGTYVFQVTNPNGRDLLSTDPAECRQFTVADGVITAVVPAGGCEHNTGTDVDHNATTVQLFPYLDTPNPGGVYKVWIVTVEDFLAGCAELGETDGLGVVDCGDAPGNMHGFIPSHSKTDNFKVKAPFFNEIDTLFFTDQNGNHKYEDSEPLLSGLSETWTDPLGASNIKWSYLVMPWNIVEAHVEAVEPGLHHITISDQPGCTVDAIHVPSTKYFSDGAGTVPIRIKPNAKNQSIFIHVSCL
jgi:hypothetical protein